MQKITPFLWFDDNAEAAANFYTSIFKNSKIGRMTNYGKAGSGPEGKVMSVSFTLNGQEFMGLNGGPVFTFSQAVSFFVNCDNPEEVEALWNRFSRGGRVLMELNKYPFSEKYGWLQDKFGVSWQLNSAKRSQKITPLLMFAGDQWKKAEEAMNYYVSRFPDSRIESIARYSKGMGGVEGTVVHGVFIMNGQEFMAMDSNIRMPVNFNPSISFYIHCESQEEVDEFWDKLIQGGEEVQCGWLKDKFGLSWQVVPDILSDMLADKDAERVERVTRAMLQMKKIDIKALKEAYNKQPVR